MSFCNPHKFVKSDKEGYEVCTVCGSFHSVAQVSPKELYLDTPYWGDGTGRSTLDQQFSNLTCTDDCGISKIDRVLQFLPPQARNVLEIACAPGALLKRLADLRCVTVGIEPSPEYIPYISEQSPHSQLVCGFFPDVFPDTMTNVFDCCIGMDIFEHFDDYDLFMGAVHRLLVPNGVGIFMSPVILEDGFYRERDFVPSEHCFIHTEKFLKPYLESMFAKVEFKRWIVGHELIIVTK